MQNARFRELCPQAREASQNIRADSGSAVREVAAFQSERLDSRLRKPAPRFDLLVRRHHCGDDCGRGLRILFGDEVDRAQGRTTVQWFGCHQHDLTICHILLLTREERTDRSYANRSSRIELDRLLKTLQLIRPGAAARES